MNSIKADWFNGTELDWDELSLTNDEIEILAAGTPSMEEKYLLIIS
jgi:hypothetical protein